MFDLMSFLIYSFVAVYSPGPNNIMSMNYASKMGIIKSYPFNIGILIGRIVIMLVSALLTGLLYLYIPMIQLPLKILGAIYMLYLAWKCLYNTININVKEMRASILNGILLQFLNVKAILSGINVLSVYIIPYFKNTIYIMGFALLFAFIAFSASICWGIFGTLFKKLFINHGKIVNIIMALLLIYCAVLLFK
jgi:threonine/homoserine/homoserine lactone efflux protein